MSGRHTSFLTQNRERNLYEFLQRHHNLKFNFWTFKEWCEKYEVRNCDVVEIRVPHTSDVQIGDLGLKRMNQDNSYSRYDFIDFELLGIPKLSPEEREEALKK